MANRCMNSLIISGDSGTLHQLKTTLQAGEKELSFIKLIPTPAGNTTYEWKLDNWGTTWSEGRVEDSGFSTDGDLYYHFLTSIGPCLPFVRKTAELYPALKFELSFAEPHTGISGQLICESGEVIKYTCESLIEEHVSPSKEKSEVNNISLDEIGSFFANI
ncbi:hypothetical protein AB4Z17_29655 [Paenibacillus sp. TAF43_2]|uniref:hypothetical protein n=1 Tax=Paenibacillus sp. TAF43_2 TaxID=3233069 RepID=UPI003F9DD6B4